MGIKNRRILRWFQIC